MIAPPKFADGAPVFFEGRDDFYYGTVLSSVRRTRFNEGESTYEYSITIEGGVAIVEEADLEFEITIDFHADIVALSEL